MSEPLKDAYPDQDAEGIRMFKASDGKLYDHQTLQSEYGLAMYNGYLNTTNSTYLARAEAYAQRLLQTKIEARGAWFWPCTYPWNLRWWPDSDILQPPFYGALGQGNTLSLFLDLYRATGKTNYLAAARKTFAAFELPPAIGEPYIVEVDGDSCLWFEEYADRPSHPQYVLNGHIFALLGVSDYYQATQDPAAAQLLEGALYTVKKWFPWFRTPGWIVKYSRSVPVYNFNYQDVVIRLLRVCYSLTGDLFFAHAAEKLADDYPSAKYASSGTVFGGLTGFQFDEYGLITNTYSCVATKPGVVWIGKRQSILNQPGAWLHIETGTLSNYWVREFPPLAVMNCMAQPIPFTPPRSIALKGGSPDFQFSTYDPRGKILDTKSLSLTNDLTIFFDQRAYINSRLSIRIAKGDLSGYWIPVEIRTTIDPP